MSKRVTDVLTETLQAAGVKTCYGIVGDTLNRIAHAIHRSEIDWVHMRHEEAGAFAAQAEALLAGRLTAAAPKKKKKKKKKNNNMAGRRQPLLHQRPLRSQSEPRPGHPGRNADPVVGPNRDQHCRWRVNRWWKRTVRLRTLLAASPWNLTTSSLNSLGLRYTKHVTSGTR